MKRTDLTAKTNEASQIVGSFGGYAQSVHYQASQAGRRAKRSLDLRVPVQNAETAIVKLGGLGTLALAAGLDPGPAGEAHAPDERDRRAAARDRRLREGAREHDAARDPSGSSIQIKLNNARRALARLRHARAGTLAAGSDRRHLAAAHDERNHAIVAHGHTSGSTRIGRLLGSAAHFLALEGIIVLYALIVLAPFLLLGALAWWILRERRRREERLLATA